MVSPYKSEKRWPPIIQSARKSGLEHSKGLSRRFLFLGSLKDLRDETCGTETTTTTLSFPGIVSRAVLPASGRSTCPADSRLGPLFVGEAAPRPSIPGPPIGPRPGLGSRRRPGAHWPPALNGAATRAPSHSRAGQPHPPPGRRDRGLGARGWPAGARERALLRATSSGPRREEAPSRSAGLSTGTSRFCPRPAVSASTPPPTPHLSPGSAGEHAGYTTQGQEVPPRRRGSHAEARGGGAHARDPCG